MNSYQMLEEVRRLSKIREITTNRVIEYNKIMYQGSDTEMFAYNVGAVDFQVYADVAGGKPYARIWLETIDDGDMGAWLWCSTIEDAIDKVEQVKTLLLDHYNSLPDTYVDLNKIIAVTGLIVEKE